MEIPSNPETRETESEQTEVLEDTESFVDFAGKVSERARTEIKELSKEEEEILEMMEKLGDSAEKKEIENEIQKIADELSKIEEESELFKIVNEEMQSMELNSLFENARNKKRIEDWEKEYSDEEKKEEIGNYKEKLKGELEREDLLAEGEDIKDRIEELRKETEEFAKKKAEAAKKIGDSVSELEGFEQGQGQEQAREMIKDLAEHARNNLNVAKLKWVLEGEEPDFGDLMDTHKDREITIENLQEMADDLEKLNDYLEKFEAMSKEAKEEAREEMEEFLKWLKEHPEIIGILAAAGALKGIELFLTAMGMGIPPWLPVAIESAIPLAVGLIGLRHVLKNKEQRERLKEFGKGALGGALGGILLLGGWLLDEKNRDEAMEAISGTKLPSWYHSWKKILGLGTEETGKS